MKAFEARQLGIEPQYKKVLETIEKAVNNGNNQVPISKSDVYPEVKELLLQDGYDIEELKMFGHVLAIIVSWENAEEGREGVVREIAPPSLSDMLSELPLGNDDSGDGLPFDFNFGHHDESDDAYADDSEVSEE